VINNNYSHNNSLDNLNKSSSGNSLLYNHNKPHNKISSDNNVILKYNIKNDNDNNTNRPIKIQNDAPEYDVDYLCSSL